MIQKSNEVYFSKKRPFEICGIWVNSPLMSSFRGTVVEHIVLPIDAIIIDTPRVDFALRIIFDTTEIYRFSV